MVTWQLNTLIVTFSPFRIDVLRRDVLVASVNRLAFHPAHVSSLPNSLGLLNFEVHRERRESDDPSMWSETFKTHADSKPYGPSSGWLRCRRFPCLMHALQLELMSSLPTRRISTAFPSTPATSASSPRRVLNTCVSLALTSHSGNGEDPYRLYNLDVFEYELDNPMALYGSIPFMTSHSPTQSAGAFLLNSAEMWVDVNYSESTTTVRGPLSGVSAHSTA